MLMEGSLSSLLSRTRRPRLGDARAEEARRMVEMMVGVEKYILRLGVRLERKMADFERVLDVGIEMK